MYARVTTYPRTSLSEARKRCEASNVAALSSMAMEPGCLGTLVLSDPMSGRVQAVSFWATDDTLVAAQPAHRARSDDISRTAGLSGGAATVEIFELVASDVAAAVLASPRPAPGAPAGARRVPALA